MSAPDREILGSLTTEARNPASEHMDELSTLEMLTLISDEDAKVADAVRSELAQIAKAVDAIAERFGRGGRLFYIGAGTSGRLGVLDASECPPTFSVDAELVQGLIAGGDHALRLSSEHSEDSREEGARDLRAAGFGRLPVERPGTTAPREVEGIQGPEGPCSLPMTEDAGEGDGARTTDYGNAMSTAGCGAAGTAGDMAGAVKTEDTLVGIAASGRTPYVLGAVEWARSVGALTVGLSCVPGSALALAAEIAITPATGPEVLTGSTRMKAGTATKMVLNMLSTGVMVRSGATFGNLMVNVRPTNAKLVDRARRIIAEAVGCPGEEAARLLEESGSSVKTAIVMGRLRVGRQAADERLKAAGGVLARVL